MDTKPPSSSGRGTYVTGPRQALGAHTHYTKERPRHHSPHSCYTCDRSRSADGGREDSTSFQQVPHDLKHHPEWAAAAAMTPSGLSPKDSDGKSCQRAERQAVHLLGVLLGRGRAQMCRHSLTRGRWPVVRLDGWGRTRSVTAQ